MSKTQRIVLLPRFTTFSGAHVFVSEPLAVSGFVMIDLAIWRGDVADGGGFEFNLQQSIDQTNWTTIATTDPGADTENVLNIPLNGSWIRSRVVLSGLGPGVTCYAYGLITARG